MSEAPIVAFKDVFGQNTPPQPDDSRGESALQRMLESEGSDRTTEVAEDDTAAVRFEGDTSRMAPEACWAFQHLVAAPFLNSDQRETWAALIRYEELLRSRLSELGLLLVIDRDRECAFTRQADDPSPRSRKLLRTQTLGLADSVLLVFCFQRYLATPLEPVVAKAELIDHAMTFRPKRGTDETKFHRKVVSAIDTLVSQGILRKVGGGERYLVHGVIISLLDTTQLDELLARYRAVADGADPDGEGAQTDE